MKKIAVLFLTAALAFECFNPRAAMADEPINVFNGIPQEDIDGFLSWYASNEFSEGAEYSAEINFGRNREAPYLLTRKMIAVEKIARNLIRTWAICRRDSYGLPPLPNKVAEKTPEELDCARMDGVFRKNLSKKKKGSQK